MEVDGFNSETQGCSRLSGRLRIETLMFMFMCLSTDVAAVFRGG